MKKSFTSFIAFIVISLPCIAQNYQKNIISKDKYGNILSVEFFSDEKNVPANSKSFFSNYLNVTADNQFKNIPHKSKNPDLIHEHFDQYYKGIKVDGAGYNFHYKNGKMYFANGHFVKLDNETLNLIYTNIERIIKK